MKNIGLKLWSLVIASAIAFYVHSQGNRGVVTLLIPVELRNLPQEKMLLLPKLPQAQVTLRGPSHLLSKITSAPPPFIFRTPEDLGERLTVSLQSSNLSIPSGVEVVSIDPPEIEFIFDDLISTRLAVTVPRIGQLDEDLRLIGLDVTPSEVIATGPRTELMGLTTIETSPIDLRSIRKTQSQPLELRLPGKFSKAEPQKVTAQIAVERIEKEVIFEKVPLSFDSQQHPEAEVRLEPKSVSVVVKGPLSKMTSFEKKMLLPSVVLDSARSESYQAPVQLELPEPFQITSIDPQQVAVQIGAATDQTK